MQKVQPSQKTVGIYGFVVLCSIFFFVYLHRVATAALAPDLMQDFSTTATELGVLSSMYFYAYALMQIPAGLLVDSIGSRKTATFFTTITAIGILLFGLAQTLLIASIARLIIGIGVSVIFVATVKILARWFRPDEVSSYFGIFVLVGNLGAIAAAAPLALVTLTIGWRLTFGFLAIIAAIQVGFAWMIIRDAPKEEEQPQPRDTRPQQNHETIEVQPGRPQLLDRFKKIARDRLIAKMAAIVFVTYGTLIAFQGLWGVPYLMQVYQLTKIEASYLITVIAVGFCVGAPLFGYLSDKVFCARKPIVRAGVLLYTLMWIPLALRTANLSKELHFALFFGLGFFHGAIPIAITMIKETVEERTIGLAVGYMNIYPMLGIAIFQPLIGWILDTVDPVKNSDPSSIPALGYATAFQFCLCCLILVSVVSLTLQETFLKPEELS